MTRGSSELAGQRVTVMGLGRFGGGQGAVEFLLSRGASVTVTDLRTADELAAVIRNCRDAVRVHWRLGGHHESDFLNTDLLIVNPAVRPGNPFVELAQSHGVPVTTEIGLFWERCRGRIAGITGTNGKSTTTQLLHDMLKSQGHRTWLGGNIGRSLLGVVDEIDADDWVVLELSSFQLMALDELRVSPSLAVVTNFAPNHLDWHRDLDEYRHAKQTILRWQRPPDIAVLSPGDDVGGWPVRGVKQMPTSGENFGTCPPELRGAHQAQNIALAVTAARAAGVDETAIQQAIDQFVGLPHRLQFIGEVRGRQVYNDSAATTPESTLAALNCIDGSKVVLVGGADKGVDLGPLADGLHQHAKAVVLMGNVAPRLAQLLSSETTSHVERLNQQVIVRSLGEAVSEAFRLSSPGDTILLSPGCSSYGWFANFVERGEEFCRRVRVANEEGHADSD